MNTQHATNTRTTTWSPVGAIKQQAAEYFADLFRRQWPDLAAKANGRIERAILIASTPGACKPSDEHPGRYLVKASSDNYSYYEVDIQRKHCTCPDSAQGHLCKHRLAIALHLLGPDWAAGANLMRERALCRLQAERDMAYQSMIGKTEIAEHADELWRSPLSPGDALIHGQAWAEEKRQEMHAALRHLEALDAKQEHWRKLQPINFIAGEPS